MAKLILMFNKQVVKEIPLLKDSITVGRNAENTIQVDNLAVSAHHARIDSTGDDFIITDLLSTNGTFVNNKKVSTHNLIHGDNIIIGKHVILFISSDAIKNTAQKDQKIDMDKTMILDTAKQKELLSKQKDTANVSQKNRMIGVVSFVDSSGLNEVELSKNLTKIGKASTSEIVLSGIFMSPTVATISRRPSGYTIGFTGGITKLKVNGAVITDNIELNDFDTIEIGSYKFQFFQKEESAKN